MELRYDITAVGQNQLRSVIRGIEQEILASNKRMTTAIRNDGARPGTRARGIGAGGSSSSTALARVAEREIKKTADVALREERKIFAEKERNVRRFAQIEISAIQTVKGEQEKADRARSKTLASIARGAGRTVGGSVTGMARAGVGAASLAGGLLIGSALNDQMQVQKGASRVAIQGMHPELKGQIAKQAQGIRGFTGEEALSGLDQFVQKSGDLKGGLDAWKMIGDVSLATGSDITQVGEAAGSAFNLISEQTKNPIERLKLLRDVMETLAVQGNKGSIEMRDFAQVLPSLAASARRFGGPQSENLKSVGALAQLAVKRGGATNAEEAATSISRFADDLITDSKAGKKHGALNVFADKAHTKLRPITDVISDVMDQTGGSLDKIQGEFGVRGRRAFSGVSPAYLDAFNTAEKVKKGTGKAAGRAAVSTAMGEFTGAGLGAGGLEDRVGVRMKDTDVQIEESLKAFNQAIGERLLPVLTDLIPQFTALVPTVTDAVGALASFIQFASQDPFVGIGAIVAGKVGLDLADAGIAAAAKAALATSLGQAGGIMIASATLGIGVFNMVLGSKEMAANTRLNAMDANEQQVRDQAKAEMDRGGLTPETRKRLEAVQEQERKRVAFTQFDDPLKGVGAGRQILNTLTGGLTGPTAVNDSTVTGTADADRVKQNMDSKAQTDALLQQANAAAKMSAAADKLSAASDKLAMLDPNRSKPIVARAP